MTVVGTIIAVFVIYLLIRAGMKLIALIMTVVWLAVIAGIFWYAKNEMGNRRGDVPVERRVR